MEELLRTLLEDLTSLPVPDGQGELGDTWSRKVLRDAIDRGFIRDEPGFVLGDNMAMHTDEANALVKAVIKRFLDRARVVARAEGLNTPEARLHAFQNEDVEASDGSTYDDFFGTSDEP